MRGATPTYVVVDETHLFRQCDVPTCKRFVRSDDPLRVCGEHFETLDRELEALPDLFERLSPMPKTHASDSLPQKPVFESKSPADDHAIMLRDMRSVGGPRWIMRQWQIAFWQHKTGLAVGDDYIEEPEFARRMRLHWPYWAKSEYAVAFYDAMHRIYVVLGQTVGMIEKPVDLGICDCGTILRSDFLTENTIICPSCGQNHDGMVEKAIREAQTRYAIANAPHWRRIVGSA